MFDTSILKSYEEVLLVASGQEKMECVFRVSFLKEAKSPILLVMATGCNGVPAAFKTSMSCAKDFLAAA